MLANFGIRLENNNVSFTFSGKIAIMAAVVDTAVKLGSEMNTISQNAFMTKMLSEGKDLIIRRVKNYSYFGEIYTAGCVTQLIGLIECGNLAHTSERCSLEVFILNRNNLVHEFGHVYNANSNQIPNNATKKALSENQIDSRGPNSNLFYGFASKYQKGSPWQQSLSVTNGEIWADRFLGWVFDKWEKDQFGNMTIEAERRARFMNTTMNLWLEP